jgi:hypothetical protein
MDSVCTAPEKASVGIAVAEQFVSMGVVDGNAPNAAAAAFVVTASAKVAACCVTGLASANT